MAPARDSSSDAAVWAGLAVEEVLTRLGTSLDGLTQNEARRRLAEGGPNVLPRPQRPPWYVRLAANFNHFFALLLWAGALLAAIGGMRELAAAIIGVVLINGLFSYWQEYQAERAVEELEALLPRQVLVKREGEPRMVAVSEVVPGDLLILTEGEAAPADARLVHAERLRIDASALTGESSPVPRRAEPIDPSAGTLISLPNLVLAGTTVVSGRAEAVVFATGGATEFGRIARLAGAQRERPSPLELELREVTRIVSLIAVTMGVVFFFTGVLLGKLSLVGAFLFAVGIIVANVPEGLLPTLTLALAMGVRRMARRKALVKRLSAVEALGAATIILTDKTGTLTENRMSVVELWTEGRNLLLTSTPAPANEAVALLVRTAALACDADWPKTQTPAAGPTGDPMEAAILRAARSLGISEEMLAAWPRVGELPFDSSRKRMTVIHQIGPAPIACVKGASGELLPRCTRLRWAGRELGLGPELRDQVEAAVSQMAGRGLRVLAVAVRELDPSQTPGRDGWEPEQIERELTLLGLLAFEDPPRPEVPAAIQACRGAGIRIVMVTGDDPHTAQAIGEQIGLFEGSPRIVTGAELDKLSPSEVELLFQQRDLLFARVAPEHKLLLVEACQRRQEVVAVTGDGVNDSPALRRAEIGIGMGETGTDVAREAADIVLADDNFASIVAAIEEGRAAYENVRKFVTYIFASNIPEIVPYLAFVLFDIPLPLTVMQILAVDLGTDLVPALALGAEHAEADLMRRPPRRRGSRLLDRPTLLRAYGWLGVLEAVFAMSAYFAAYWLSGWRPGRSLWAYPKAYPTATTMTLAAIVSCQVGNVFACRSWNQSTLKLGLLSNRLVVAGIGVEIAVLVALIYLPPLASAFGLAPLSLTHWLLLAPLGPAVFLLEEARKACARRFRR